VPHYLRSARFLRDYDTLTPAQRSLVKGALNDFLDDLPSGQFRPALRVKRLQGNPGIFEMTWEYHDGRAHFRHGDTRRDAKRA
jgi:hypothetical protein